MFFVFLLCSGHLQGVSVGGDPGQAALPPVCLHRQHQVHPSGMVCSDLTTCVLPLFSQAFPFNVFSFIFRVSMVAIYLSSLMSSVECKASNKTHEKQYKPLEFSVFWWCFHSLLQWLKHSRKEYCELCKHRFAFTPSKSFFFFIKPV